MFHAGCKTVKRDPTYSSFAVEYVRMLGHFEFPPNKTYGKFLG